MRLFVASAALVAAVLGVQLGAGGGSYVPRTSPPPCSPTSLPPDTKGLDGLAEQLVLLGLDAAACSRHQTRERLLLDLSEDHAPTSALRTGLLTAVRRLGSAHRLPPVSTLLSEVLDESSLPTVAKLAVRAIPDAAIDATLPTQPLLAKSVQHLDLGQALGHLDDPSQLESVLTRAVLRAAGDQVVEDVKGLL